MSATDVTESLHPEAALTRSTRELEVRNRVAEAFLTTDGEDMGVIGISMDVTQRKQAQEEVDRHREHLEDLVKERIKEQACLFEIAEVLADASESTHALLHKVLEVIPSGWQHTEITSARLTMASQVFATGSFKESPWCQSADVVVEGAPIGRLEVVYLEARPAADEGPFLREERELITTIAKMLGQAIERRRAEDSLLESNVRFRTLFDVTPEAIFVIGPGERFLDVNEAAITRYGYSHEEFLTMGPRDLSARALRQDAPSQIGRASARASRFEWVHRAKDGHEIQVEIQTAPFTLEGQPCALASVRDITARREAEEEQRRLYAQLTQSQRLEAIGTLASGVAHEINNPLNIVMNFAQLILDEEDTPAAAREFAAMIGEQSERMATIVRNLLAFSRNDRETHSPADVPTLVESTLSLIGASFRKDQITISTDLADDLPKICCRSQQIQQVLLNLLTNARDALNTRFLEPSPEKTIRVASRRFTRDDEDWVRLSVEDHGDGISPEIAEHLFDPFFTSKEKDKGTGLGLSISYGIIKEHKGEIWFESDQGVGTTFHVDLKVNNGWSLSSRVAQDEA